jgi:5-methylcytosine-specific restriction endonuclease McrBC GTP-binding regulatory subunit McrB
MINRDQLHKQALEGVLKQNGAIIRPTQYPYNLIYFGAPGTGKSNAIDSYASDGNSIKITFHPDTDYSAFVGSYKPIQAEGANGISYGFVAQAFLQAYTKAWETEEDTFLIIEEINRGNCAQIFGDIFQIIERGEDGYSKYKIDVDSEIEKYLKKHYEDLIAAGGADEAKASRYINYFGGSFKKIALPNNLFIHATMNTSDQSLFPIDSAFKRRWDWEYVPIQFEGTEANSYKIKIGDENYSWRSFVEAVNDKIKAVTDSEDKKLGQFFVKSFDNSISEKTFKGKVLFYLWNDILKDEPQADEKYFFRKKTDTADVVSTTFTFNDLFSESSTQVLKGFMNYLGIAVIPE